MNRIVRTPAELAGGTDLLERAVTYAVIVLSQLAPDDLSRPTPCAGWDVRHLLTHLGASCADLAEVADSGRLFANEPESVAEPEPADGADILAGVRDRTGRVLSAWTRMRDFRPAVIGEPYLDRAVVACAGAVEVSAHAWDIARACELGQPFPPSLAADLLPLVPMLIGPADRRDRFAPPVRTRPEAGPAEQLLAFLGRDAYR